MSSVVIFTDNDPMLSLKFSIFVVPRSDTRHFLDDVPRPKPAVKGCTPFYLPYPSSSLTLSYYAPDSLVTILVLTAKIVKHKFQTRKYNHTKQEEFGHIDYI
ncbi:Uncharacterized protein Fot_22719 [Forsythia ovata]|uniref:Uncharacterized protein n=1 Tax=Forsythia ovata TaxID=205694 RepID=A0ABD1V0H3_9LAMI